MIRVLLMDDEPAIVEALGLALTEYGMGARAAANGVRALESLTRSRPDIVLSKWMMPLVDGDSHARAFRTRQNWLPSRCS